jgi:phage gp46-like protein
MDTHINPLTRDYDGKRIDTLANAVYLRLMTPLGSWWADTTLGSRLHELQREKDLTRVYVLAKQYAEIALAPIVKDGRAKSIDVQASRLQEGVCLLHIVVQDKGGRRLELNHHVRVQ